MTAGRAAAMVQLNVGDRGAPVPYAGCRPPVTPGSTVAPTPLWHGDPPREMPFPGSGVSMRVRGKGAEMTDDTVAKVPPDPTMAGRTPAAARPVGPPSSLDLWAQALVMHRCFGEDDVEPNIFRSLD